ncbi:universal stress protein [Nonomuraea sp. NPDC059194]|uniref:universal stress protein n=1 Tax=Nonomuraea sp. NPDC059194 TaxID=3346764 RepID=UPI00369B375F
MNAVIVVGTDGSAGATRAVMWAAQDAALKRSRLQIAHVLETARADVPYNPPREVAERLLAEAARSARELGPAVEVTVRLLAGHPATELRALAENADELVVGSRGLGGFASALLGSVSLGVAGRVHRPVVVVRPAAAAQGAAAQGAAAQAEIVVGVDGSADSEAALEYAVTEAALRQAPLRVVRAWQVPPHVMSFDPLAAQQEQAELVADLLAPWRDKHPEVSFTKDVVCAHPAAALVNASKNATLVVVGSRGRGQFAAAVLGSVSHGVLCHAHCPVAVVRR